MTLFFPCPNHNGINICEQDCPKCGAVMPEGAVPWQRVERWHANGSTTREDDMIVTEEVTATIEPAEAEPDCTISIGRGDGTFTDPISMEEFDRRCEEALADPTPAPRPDFGVIDRNTGELQQLSLLGAQWEQYRVASVHWSITGGDRETKSAFDELVGDGELTPGAVVRILAVGVVKEHAPIYKKGLHEGKTAIVLDQIKCIEVIGHMTGAVEIAQNVDGEAKTEDEAEVSE